MRQLGKSIVVQARLNQERPNEEQALEILNNFKRQGITYRHTIIAGILSLSGMNYDDMVKLTRSSEGDFTRILEMHLSGLKHNDSSQVILEKLGTIEEIVNDFRENTVEIINRILAGVGTGDIRTNFDNDDERNDYSWQLLDSIAGDQR